MCQNARKHPILVGKQIGRWNVLRKDFKAFSDGDSGYWCRCSCGTEKYVRDSALISGCSKSCGCGGRRRKCLPGESGFNTVMLVYKLTAKKRDLSFTLTKEEIKDLTGRNCFYCDSPPSNYKKTSGKDTYGDYTYNGIDRVDNTQGYHKDNCVPCCRICNLMKNTSSQEEFFQHVKKIDAFQKTRGK